MPVDLFRGDYVGAGLSAVDVIPVIGEAADAAKAARIADHAADAVKAIDKAIDAAKVVKNVSTNSLIQTHKITMSKKQFSALVDNIRENGIKESIKYVEYNGKKYVVDGHHRLKAAKQLGLKEVPAEKVTLPYKGYKTIDDILWMD